MSNLWVAARVDGVDYDVTALYPEFTAEDHIREVWFGVWQNGFQPVDFDIRNIKVGTTGFGSSNVWAPALASTGDFDAIYGAGSGLTVSGGVLTVVNAGSDRYGVKDLGNDYTDLYVQLEIRMRPAMIGVYTGSFHVISTAGGGAAPYESNGLVSFGDGAWSTDIGDEFGTGPVADTWITIGVHWQYAPVRIRFEGAPLWRFLVTNLDGETLTILDKRATERSLLFTLNGPATHTGLVPSDDPEINIPSPTADSAAFVAHNVRLVYGLRREGSLPSDYRTWRPRFGGILMTTEDVAADTPTTRYTAYDPWQYLMARPARNPDSTLPTTSGVQYRDARASDIAVELLANTVAVDGDVFIDASDSGLIEDTDVIDGLTKFDQGLSVGEAWQQLCDTGTIDIVLRPIYDPENRPGKLCELVIAKRAGAVRYGAVFGWDRAGRSATEMSRLIDGTRLANKVKLFLGSGISLPVQTATGSVTTYGEYWSQKFVLGKQSQDALALLLALAQVQIRKDGDRTITFSPAPERSVVALSDYGLGDYVPVWASRALRNPLGIDYDSFDADAPGASGYQRIFAIPIELDDNGVERVTGILTSSDSLGEL